MLFDGKLATELSHPLRRLNTVSRIILISALAILSYSFNRWPALLVVFIVVVSLKAIPERSLKGVFRTIRVLAPFLVIILLINLFLVGREMAISFRIFFGLKQGLRVVTLLLALRVFFETTTPIELSDTFFSLLAPLKRLGLKVSELSFIVMMTFSFIPLITEEARRIKLAQSVRSGFKEGFSEVRRLAPLIVPLIVGIFRRAEDLESALKVRYFSRREPAISSAGMSFSPVDIAVIALSIFVLFAGFVFSVQL